MGELTNHTSAETVYLAGTNKVVVKSTAPNANASAQTPSGENALPAGKTHDSGDPVSLFSGEELLTLSDITLPGILPFVWRRFYRSSGIEQRDALGWGWSHSANPQLIFGVDDHTQEAVAWFFDDENRVTRLLLPTPQTPLTTNRLGGGVISLKQDEFSNEYCVQWSEGQGTYHFLRDGDASWFRGISDGYGNRVNASYDNQGRLATLGTTRLASVLATTTPLTRKGSVRYCYKPVVQLAPAQRRTGNLARWWCSTVTTNTSN